MRWRVSPTCHPEPEMGEPGLSSHLSSHLTWADPFHLLINTMRSLTLPQNHFPPSPYYPGAAPGEPCPRFGMQSDPHTLSLCRAREAPAVQECRLHEPALQGEVAVQRVRHRAALLQEPCARVPCVSAALGLGKGTATSLVASEGCWCHTGGSLFQLVRALCYPVAG